jgi:hypothetical protein
VRYFKRFEYNMWRVHAFEDDPSADAYIPQDAVPITEAESQHLSKQLPSSELTKALEEGAAALGGRGLSRYPTKDFKEAIGHICANSAHLEVSLRTTIWHLAGISAEVGMALTGGKLATNQLTETLLTLVELRYPHLIESAKAITKQINDLNNIRGRYVHGIWHPGKDGKVLVGKTFLARTHAKGQAQEVSLDEIYGVAEGYLKIESEMLTTILMPLVTKASK